MPAEMWIKELEQAAPALVPSKSTNTLGAGNDAADKSVEESAFTTLEESHGQNTILADIEAKASCCADALEDGSSKGGISMRKKAAVTS